MNKTIKINIFTTEMSNIIKGRRTICLYYLQVKNLNIFLMIILVTDNISLVCGSGDGDERRL